MDSYYNKEIKAHYEDEIGGPGSNSNHGVLKLEAIDFFIKQTSDERSSANIIIQYLGLTRKTHSSFNKPDVNHQKFGDGNLYCDENRNKVYIYENLNSNNPNMLKRTILKTFKGLHWENKNPTIISLITSEKKENYKKLIRNITEILEKHKIPTLIYKYGQKNIDLCGMYQGLVDEEININII